MKTMNTVKSHRQARHWSQEQLAEISGLSVRTIQRIEQGKRAGLESWKSLSAVFELPIAELQGDADNTIGAQAMHRDPSPHYYPPSQAYPDYHTDHDPRTLREPHYGATNSHQSSTYSDRLTGHPTNQLSQEEAEALKAVRRLRKVYLRGIRTLLLIAILVGINWLTGSDYWWSLWPAGVFGILLVIDVLRVANPLNLFDANWERRAVEKRLKRRL